MAVVRLSVDRLVALFLFTFPLSSLDSPRRLSRSLHECASFLFKEEKLVCSPNQVRSMDHIYIYQRTIPLHRQPIRLFSTEPNKNQPHQNNSPAETKPETPKVTPDHPPDEHLNSKMMV